jgi:hypothetical protein
LHFIHYFLFKGFHQFVLHLINEWTEKPKAEKWNDVISIIKSLAFGVSPSYLETTSTNDFESRSDFNDHEMEKNDESEDDSSFSQPSPNLQTIPLNNPMEFFLHRLQVFQAFYSKVKSFGFPISSLFYFGEARLRAIIGQVEEVHRVNKHLQSKQIFFFIWYDLGIEILVLLSRPKDCSQKDQS